MMDLVAWVKCNTDEIKCAKQNCAQIRHAGQFFDPQANNFQWFGQ